MKTSIKLILAILTAGVLISAHAQANITPTEVNRMMRPIHAVPYAYSQSWTDCDKVFERGYGDCKGKSMALYKLMIKSGAENVRFIVGLKTGLSHAWLQWDCNGTTYVLDPTFYDRAFLQSEIK
jgi:hypothetical protein